MKKNYDLDVAEYAVASVGQFGLPAAEMFINGIDP